MNTRTYPRSLQEAFRDADYDEGPEFDEWRFEQREAA